MFQTDVFVSGTEGYAVYRIPAITIISNGDVLAFAEARTSIQDAAENDIVMKRSRDHGQTWEKLTVIASAGKDSLNNPTVVVEKNSQTIFLFFQRYPYPYKERNVVPGLEGDRVLQSFVIMSTDMGKTWSDWVNLTPVVKSPVKWTSIASGPGIGIQIQNGPHQGRLVIPYNHGPWGNWGVYASYSDDGGKTWFRGTDAPLGTKRGPNEVQVVELNDGDLLLNARSYARGLFKRAKPKCRVVARSEDGGQTWSKIHPDPVLIEPRCQGSILRYNFPEDPLGTGGGRILFSNPASEHGRINGTIRVSYDDCQTWPVRKTIQEGPFAYSCLVRLANDNMGCLYETGDKKDAYDRIKLAIFTLKWLEE